ncbi:MAG: two-component hybrid sensor and regulator [Vampirovibrio sp.]|nr:two-component hybrid sensor and regulator [Vampirovibrio sp.]
MPTFGMLKGRERIRSPMIDIPDDQQVFHRSVKELADIKYALDESAIVAVTDAGGVITYVNNTFCEISKFSREELLGKTHRIINSGYHPPEFFWNLWQVIIQGHIWRGEICNKAKDGSLYWVDTTIVPFLDEQTGKPYQYIAIRKDITYLKRIENELRLLNEGLEERVQERTARLEAANRELQGALNRLQESERMRETFISALTHDLRTPLVAERRALDLLHSQRESLPEKLQPLTERLIKNNSDLLEMVSKLLEIYEYEAGKVRLFMKPVCLYSLIQECLETLQPLADSKHIVLINRAEKLAPSIADEDQLRRLLINLAGNAIQHMQQAGEVMVFLRDTGDMLELQVSDNGPGIDADVLPHLFDRYFTVQQTRKKIGSGLGLSICKMITRLHGGNIRVESEPGRGTDFYVSLPKQSHLSQAQMPHGEPTHD